MTEGEFNQILGRLQAQDGRFDHFVWLVNKMIKMLDDADYEDIFGTEGWRHFIGWNE